MYIILMNKNKSLTTSKRVDLYEDDNLADKIRFLFPEVYNGIRLSECIVRINYRDLTGEEKKEILVKDDELYKNRLSYHYPVDSKFTEFYGKILFEISFSKANLDTDSEEILFHTESHSIEILPRSNSIPPEEILPEDSVGKILKEVYEIEERVKELEHKDNDISNVVQYVEQNLTEEQKEQARKNIGVLPPVQSDWEQIDDVAVDYIKNRTHGYEEKITDVNETFKVYTKATEKNENLLPDDFYQALITHSICDLKVMINGQECTKTSENDRSITFITGDGYPVNYTSVTINKDINKISIAEYYDWFPTIPFVEKIIPVTFTGYCKGSIIKQLDEKYIPDSIQRVSDTDKKISELKNDIDELEKDTNKVLEAVTYLEYEDIINFSDGGNFVIDDDGEGNITITSTKINVTDVDSNVIIESSMLKVVDDNQGNVTILEI